MVLVLLLTAVPVGWCGFQDFTEALTFAGCVTGVALMSAALIMVLGVAAVVDCWVRGASSNFGMIALISTGVALLTNVLLALQIWNDGELVVFKVLTIVLSVGSLFAVLLVWRRLDAIPTPKRVAVALIVSTAVAVTNFSYQYLFQPYRREATPLVQLNVGKAVLSADRKAFSVPVDIKLVNHSDMAFYVLGAEFHAMGEDVTVSRTDVSKSKWREEAEKWAMYREKHPLTRREVYQPGKLVEAQPWMPAGNWVEANDESLTRAVVQLPSDTNFDKLTFYASLSLARKDRLVLQKFGESSYSWRGKVLPQWVKDEKKENDTIVQTAGMRENNAIDNLTRKKRNVTTFWIFGPHGVDVSLAIAPEGEEDRPLSPQTIREVGSRYGLLDVLAGPVEETLEEVKAGR
ncbi:hypothetical protein [Streptomyces sp. PanSC9]|uniref:hypothetical protein n=1 Tax=Streptomyces sp. PanSC9 TaxID=1520461 RepID=UPI0011CDDFCD|nr:hypothetical protein [Streptomyces sp. PanSC9]